MRKNLPEDQIREDRDASESRRTRAAKDAGPRSDPSKFEGTASTRETSNASRDTNGRPSLGKAAKSATSGRRKHENEVGYGRPPNHSRFVKGFSGNPRGRPKGRKSAKDKREAAGEEAPHALARMIAKEGGTVVRVERDGVVKEMTRMELLVRAMMDRAEAGDFKALKFVLEIGLASSDGNLRRVVARSNRSEDGESDISARGSAGSGRVIAEEKDPIEQDQEQLRVLRERESELLGWIEYERSFLEKYGHSTMAATSKRRLDRSLVDLDLVQAWIRSIEYSMVERERAMERRMRSTKRRDP